MLPINTFILYPTILIHGIGGDISDLYKMQESLESKGVETYNIEIGNGKIDSIIWNINTMILNSPKLCIALFLVLYESHY